MTSNFDGRAAWNLDIRSLRRREEYKLAKPIADRIMILSTNKARARIRANNGHGWGWICGTGTSSFKQVLVRFLIRDFSVEQLKFIVEHLQEETNNLETSFNLQDSNEKELCDEINNRLNELIPRTHANWV